MKTNQILFSKFEIIECLKKNETTSVYLANHIHLSKKIIFKVLEISKINNDDIISRFKREGRLLAKLDHKNIIKVYDFGVEKDFFYISFEYFESNNLRYILEREKLNPEIIDKIILQLLNVIKYIHEKKIIHRDLKPENILVDKDFKIKITDFGLSLSKDETKTTSSESLVGTPAYMSPEQISNNKVSYQSDIFSMGLIILELLTKKNIFLDENINKTINNILCYDENKIKMLIDSVQEKYKVVLLSFLRKEPEKRIYNLSEIIFNLNPDTEKDIEIARNRKIGSSIKVFAVVAFIVTIFIAIYFLFVQKAKENPKIELLKIQNCKNVFIQSVEAILHEANITFTDRDITIQPEDKITNENNTEKENKNAIIEYGGLYIDCIPWADIYIENKKIETTPLSKKIELQIGPYELKLINPDFPEYSKYIIIKKNETLNISVNLENLISYIIIKIYPWGKVYIDGNYIGDTPFSDKIKLLTGKHRIVIQNPEYEDYIHEVTLKENETFVLEHRFE